MIDLVATSSPSLLHSCETILPLSNSDHLGLLLKQSHQPQINKKRTMWRYNNADWEKANELLAATNWPSLITGDIDKSWENWRMRFLEVMQQCVPWITLPLRRNLPWLNKGILQLIRKRNQLFSRAKSSKREVDLDKYRKMCNRVLSQVRTAKTNYFKRINPRVIPSSFGRQ